MPDPTPSDLADALESGDWEPYTGFLAERDNDRRRCCLGVACALVDEPPSPKILDAVGYPEEVGVEIEWLEANAPLWLKSLAGFRVDNPDDATRKVPVSHCLASINDDDGDWSRVIPTLRLLGVWTYV